MNVSNDPLRVKEGQLNPLFDILDFDAVMLYVFELYVHCSVSVTFHVSEPLMYLMVMLLTGLSDEGSAVLSPYTSVVITGITFTPSVEHESWSTNAPPWNHTGVFRLSGDAHSKLGSLMSRVTELTAAANVSAHGLKVDGGHAPAVNVPP